jgi:ABC-2 type transport system ATP-binding protein
VRSIEQHEATDGRQRFTVTVSGDHDLRPDIFTLAKDRGWTLFELHQEAGNLEDLFRQLTGGAS